MALGRAIGGELPSRSKVERRKAGNEGATCLLAGTGVGSLKDANCSDPVAGARVLVRLVKHPRKAGGSVSGAASKAVAQVL